MTHKPFGQAYQTKQLKDFDRDVSERRSELEAKLERLAGTPAYERLRRNHELTWGTADKPVSDDEIKIHAPIYQATKVKPLGQWISQFEKWERKKANEAAKKEESADNREEEATKAVILRTHGKEAVQEAGGKRYHEHMKDIWPLIVEARALYTPKAEAQQNRDNEKAPWSVEEHNLRVAAHNAKIVNGHIYANLLSSAHITLDGAELSTAATNGILHGWPSTTREHGEKCKALRQEINGRTSAREALPGIAKELEAHPEEQLYAGSLRQRITDSIRDKTREAVRRGKEKLQYTIVGHPDESKLLEQWLREREERGE